MSVGSVEAGEGRDGIAAATHATTPVGRRTRKIAEKLARQIVDDILERGQVGDVLPPEADMIASYQVGRATLREALRLLEVQGIITIKSGPGGGPIVSATSTWHFASMMKLHLQMRGATHAEVMQARLAIEPLMARLAAERKDRAGLDTLRDVLRDEGTVVLEDDPAFTRVSWGFHATVANLSGNRVLDLLAHSLQEIYESRVRASMTPVKERPGVHKTHLAIGKAILEGRGVDAEVLMREHMFDFTKRVKRAYPEAFGSRVEWD